MKKNLFFSLILIISILFISACGQSSSGTQGSQGSSGSDAPAPTGESHTFKLSMIVQPTHTWYKAAEKFDEELQARSDGRMNVEIFPSSQLGPEADVIQQMSTGAVDFGFITNSYLASRFDSLNAWLMPFLFSGIEDAVEMRDSETAKELLDLFEAQGIVGLDWLFTGSHSILMKDGVLGSPDAFIGKQIRAPGSAVINDFYTELGASPLPMPLTEVYTSLQTGVIDGINGSVDSVTTEKFHEVANDFTLLNQFAFNAAVIMGKPTFDKLSEEDRQIVLDAMRAAIDYGNEVAMENDREGLEELRELVNVHEISDFSAFDEVKQTIYNKYSEGDDLIKRFIEEALN